MTTKRKWIFCSTIGLLCAVAACVATLLGTLRDCYAQWVTAELVILFQQERGRLPANWRELEPIYGDGHGLHHGGLVFAQVRQRMVIEFTRLPDLQSLSLATANAVSVPTVVYARSDDLTGTARSRTA
jgi:hypothetical protein